jgi:hypothetical protein
MPFFLLQATGSRSRNGLQSARILRLPTGGAFFCFRIPFHRYSILSNRTAAVFHELERAPMRRFARKPLQTSKPSVLPSEN